MLLTKKVKHNNLLKLGYKSLGPQKEMGKSMEPNYNMLAPICDNSNKSPFSLNNAIPQHLVDTSNPKINFSFIFIFVF